MIGQKLGISYKKPIFLASPVFMNYPLQGQGNWVWRVISCTPTFRPLPLKKTSFCIKNSDLPTYSLFCTPSFYLLLPTCFRTWNSREKKNMHFFFFSHLKLSVLLRSWMSHKIRTLTFAVGLRPYFWPLRLSEIPHKLSGTSCLTTTSEHNGNELSHVKICKITKF